MLKTVYIRVKYSVGGNKKEGDISVEANSQKINKTLENVVQSKLSQVGGELIEIVKASRDYSDIRMEGPTTALSK